MFKRISHATRSMPGAKVTLYSPVSIGVIMLALMLLAFNITQSELPFAGKLTMRGERVAGVTENDIVVNKGDVRNAAYYSLGLVQTLEGYTVDPEFKTKDDVKAR